MWTLNYRSVCLHIISSTLRIYYIYIYTQICTTYIQAQTFVRRYSHRTRIQSRIQYIHCCTHFVWLECDMRNSRVYSLFSLIWILQKKNIKNVESYQEKQKKKTRFKRKCFKMKKHKILVKCRSEEEINENSVNKMKQLCVLSNQQIKIQIALILPRLFQSIIEYYLHFTLLNYLHV